MTCWVTQADHALSEPQLTHLSNRTMLSIAFLTSKRAKRLKPNEMNLANCKVLWLKGAVIIRKGQVGRPSAGAEGDLPL